MVLRVELDSLCEQVDGGIVVFGLEGFVSLILELCGLRNLISVAVPARCNKSIRLTWFWDGKAGFRSAKPRLFISLPK